jgi:hypothetical protein
VPRKKSVDSKDEQLQKLRPDIELLRSTYETNRFNAYLVSPTTSNSLMLSAIKFVGLQQRNSAKRKQALSDAAQTSSE